jgi:hypothetical protein
MHEKPSSNFDPHKWCRDINVRTKDFRVCFQAGEDAGSYPTSLESTYDWFMPFAEYKGKSAEPSAESIEADDLPQKTAVSLTRSADILADQPRERFVENILEKRPHPEIVEQHTGNNGQLLETLAVDKNGVAATAETNHMVNRQCLLVSIATCQATMRQPVDLSRQSSSRCQVCGLRGHGTDGCQNVGPQHKCNI